MLRIKTANFTDLKKAIKKLVGQKGPFWQLCNLKLANYVFGVYLEFNDVWSKRH